MAVVGVWRPLNTPPARRLLRSISCHFGTQPITPDEANQRGRRVATNLILTTMPSIPSTGSHGRRGGEFGAKKSGRQLHLMGAGELLLRHPGGEEPMGCEGKRRFGGAMWFTSYASLDPEFATTEPGSQVSRGLVDKRRIRCRGGHGGSGRVSFIKHAKHFMVGPGWPAGGGGGLGGSVVVTVSERCTSLAHIKGNVTAEPGRPGGKQHTNGAAGRNSVTVIPRGCVIWRIDKAEECKGAAAEGRNEHRKVLLCDLNELNSPPFVTARGGKGGRGNNSLHPHTCEPGQPGEEVYIELELKSIADVGLVGFPNAGKSTLLGAISRACPKIAPYPFTTLAPHIGNVEYSDGHVITVADLPGLVEGAHLNVGLGHEFLRHIERTEVLVYVVDMASGASDPLQAFLCLRHEVEAYANGLPEKPFCVVASKCDIRPFESLPKVDELWKLIHGRFPGVEVIPVSSRFGDGITNFIKSIRKVMREAREEKERVFEAQMDAVYRNASIIVSH